MDPQDLIADAVTEPALLGESIMYVSHGSPNVIAIKALVERQPPDPADGDAGALELRLSVSVRKQDLPQVQQGRDRVVIQYRGATKSLRVDRLIGEDEALWSMECVE